MPEGKKSGRHGQWEGRLCHIWASSPVQRLLLRDVFKLALVLLPEAAKLIAGAEFVSRGAGELDVKGRGGEVNLGTGSEKQKKKGEEKVSVSGGSPVPGSPAILSHPGSPAPTFSPIQRLFVK